MGGRQFPTKKNKKKPRLLKMDTLPYIQPIGKIISEPPKQTTISHSIKKQRNKGWISRHYVFAAILLVAVCVAVLDIGILESFPALGKRAIIGSLYSGGTTLLGFVGSVILALSDLFAEIHQRGWLGMKEQWKTRLKYWAILWIVWWGLIFSWHLVSKTRKEVWLQADNERPTPIAYPNPNPFLLLKQLKPKTTKPSPLAVAAPGSVLAHPTLETPEISETFTRVQLSMGSSNFFYDVSRLREHPVNPLDQINPMVPMSLYIKGAKLCVDIALYVAGFPGGLRIGCNQFDVTGSPQGWDYNSTSRAVEVINQEGNPVFQLVFLSPSHISVAGTFATDTHVVWINESGIHAIAKFLVESGGSGITIPASPKPIFKYPAWKHPGEYIQ